VARLSIEAWHNAVHAGEDTAEKAPDRLLRLMRIEREI
jgi:hypothetical protein